MKKPGRPKLQGIIEPPSHNHISGQSHDKATEQLRDAEVPNDAASGIETPGPRRAKARAAVGELKDYAHRSLYARPETLELIRELAFKERVSAQALYREGLFLMLRGRGLFEGKTVDDV